MRTDIFRPFDITVSGVGEIARFENKQYPLPRHDIQRNFENADDIPGDPLLAIAEQNE